MVQKLISNFVRMIQQIGWGDLSDRTFRPVIIQDHRPDKSIRTGLIQDRRP
ncbi:hypothetical protein [Spirosoma sp. KCTC 42546]|uniref:hypothetical protein n=1 Tax=Spirosoma sp. KCTC 42546 TaxID=2520506 RepID=UPI00143D735E|nr:hypothetical protein [Spirosoma sp. KCTC 42546]